MNEQSFDAGPDGVPLTLERKRALYRAQHRGTKEMDWMIGRYAAAKLAGMSDTELELFEKFLEIGDPELNAWLLDPATCAVPVFSALIDDIRVFNSLA